MTAGGSVKGDDYRLAVIGEDIVLDGVDGRLHFFVGFFIVAAVIFFGGFQGEKALVEVAVIADECAF